MSHCTYIYTDPKTEYPIYVGEGSVKNNRPLDHLVKSSNKWLGNIIEKRIDEGYEIKPEILCYGTKEYCQLIELRLIELYGRRDLDAGGILVNRALGGDLGRTGLHNRNNHNIAISEAKKKWWSENPEAKKKNNFTTNNPSTINGSAFKGKNHTDETKTNMSLSKKGKSAVDIWGEVVVKKRLEQLEKRLNSKHNPNFKGYWITPWGKFTSKFKAIKECPNKIGVDAIRSMCKTNKKITNWYINRFDFITVNDVGKTFSDIGFGFEPV